MANVAKLIEALRTEFKMKAENDRRHVSGIIHHGGPYHNVSMECAEFMLTRLHFKALERICTECQCDYFITPRQERESTARHYITFFF